MLILLINTCAVGDDAGNVIALADATGVVAAEALPGRGSSEAMLPGLRRIFAACGRLPAQLTAVAVVVGPGSFTGVRAGLSTAKGLCEASGCGLIGLSRLALLAGDETASGTEETLALLDAGRGEFFCGRYCGGKMLAEELLTAVAAREWMGGRHAVACEAGVVAALGAVELRPEPGAGTILKAALRRIADGEWSDVALTDANYLRRTDAERALSR